MLAVLGGLNVVRRLARVIGRASRIVARDADGLFVGESLQLELGPVALLHGQVDFGLLAWIVEVASILRLAGRRVVRVVSEEVCRRVRSCRVLNDLRTLHERAKLLNLSRVGLGDR